ncbi:aldehyde dehydrogenase family protein [soil metagenome]
MSIIESTGPSAAAAPPASQQKLDETEKANLDAAIDELSAGAARWAASSLTERAQLISRVHAAITPAAELWATTASEIKGLAGDSQLRGEEWISGPYATLSGAGTLAKTIAALASGASPLDGIRFGTAPGGRVTVPFLPHDAKEALLFNGFHGEVWMPPGVTEATVRSQVGLGELHPTESGGVGLVLGAGNITSIPPLDVLYEIVAENRSVLLKLNPVMARMLPVYTAALAPLIEFGVLRIVQGAAAVGSYLAHHAKISHVHITGSAATHDAIVWGGGAEGAARRAAGTPLLTKPITSELGGVAPIIVVPGAWTKRDLRFQAEHVATMRLHNGGYNCIAGQVVVLSSGWPQKAEFVAELRAAIERTPGRTAWYPGSDGRVDGAKASYPAAENLEGCLLIDVTGGGDAHDLQTTEYFSPVLGVVEVAGSGQAFLDAAVTTVNDDFVGTLGANVIVQPKDRSALGAGFDEAIARLEYGTIAINTWTGLGFLSAPAPWGAFPGHTLEKVGSGIGRVHNAFLLDAPERTVVTGPFRPFPRSFAHGEFTLFPKPPWFVTARSAATTGRRLAAYAAKPSWLKMPAIFLSAFKA